MFTSINGVIQGRYLTEYLAYSDWWFIDPRFLVGQLVFLLGMAGNIHSDAILRGLRKPGETGYKIPRGIINLLLRATQTPNYSHYNHRLLFIPRDVLF